MTEAPASSQKPIVALIAPGQSGQEIGMGQEIAKKSKAAERIWAITNNALRERIGGYDFTDLVWKNKINGVEITKADATRVLTQTPNTQVAVFADTIARWEYGKEIGIISVEIDSAGGLSLGRWAAAVITGAIEFNEDTVNLVRDRGEAFYAVRGWLVTLIDLDPDLTQEVRDKGRQRIGNSYMYKSMDLTPNSFSVGGLDTSRAAMQKWLDDNGLEKGSDYVWPRVSNPFHTKLMKIARAPFARSLKRAKIVEPTNGVLIGNGGRILIDPEDTRRDFEDQTNVLEDFLGIGRTLLNRRVNRIISLSARDPEANMLGEIATDPEVNREVIVLPLSDGSEDKTLIGHQVLAA